MVKEYVNQVSIVLSIIHACTRAAGQTNFNNVNTSSDRNHVVGTLMSSIIIDIWHAIGQIQARGEARGEARAVYYLATEVLSLNTTAPYFGK